ncbi:MAG: hypothetical protein DSO01_03445 [Archaeoglobi archaeon]|nr:MAG: hypothetical protein DSO01_03445 [Archaeoglobi archaeon]TDA28339.1 MAG: hypothetical protein DSO00_05865 [Archaeoglobi archaeon]
MEIVRCETCRRELNIKDKNKDWRECFFCKKPVCFDDLHYVGVWKRGLYDEFIEVVPVCKNCRPKKWR